MGTRSSGSEPSPARGAIAVAVLGLCIAIPALAQESAATLRKQLEEQRALIQEQARQLQAQQRKIEEQERTLDQLSRRLGRIEDSGSKGAPQPMVASASPGSGGEADTQRDTVGDLNASAVRAGDFPGSFKISGSSGVSLAIGGSIKAVAIRDSRAEAMGSDFLPALLGLSRPDRKGATSLDTTLTKLHFDGRVPLADGSVRGYVEYDFNGGNDGSLGLKMRHAYGSWTMGTGTLVAGHTWSTLMDLSILPEGLTEPTVSGVIFNRQPIMRWSSKPSPQFGYHVAVEDPSSGDIGGVQPSAAVTSAPDLIVAMDFDPQKSTHLRLGGIMRRLEVDVPDGAKQTANAWGVTLTGVFGLAGHDRLVFSALYGKGLGRYLLGIPSSSGSVVDPLAGRLRLRENTGAMISFQHHWSDDLRSTAMVGQARSKAFAWQAGDAFEKSSYFAVNLMKRIRPFITMGVEYAYGKSESVSGASLDNHRIALGIQMF